MSRDITLVNTATDTFAIWINRTNDVINAVSVECITTNSHANGALTSGNGYVQGYLGAANLVATNLRGGTIETPAVLTITSNVISTGNKITIGTVVVNSSDISINSVSITELAGLIRMSINTTGISDQLVHNFSKLGNRGAEYIVTLQDQNANQVQIEKFLVIHDSGEAYTTEYGVVFSNTILGEFSANANSTHVKVYLSPTVSNVHVSGSVILVTI